MHWRNSFKANEKWRKNKHRKAELTDPDVFASQFYAVNAVNACLRSWEVEYVLMISNVMYCFLPSHSIQNSGTQSRHLSQDFAEWLGKRFVNSKVFDFAFDFAFFRIWIWNVKKTAVGFFVLRFVRRRSWNGHGELARLTKSESQEYARCIYVRVYISYIHGPGIIPICSLLYDVYDMMIYVYIFCIYIYTIDTKHTLNTCWLMIWKYEISIWIWQTRTQ